MPTVEVSQLIAISTMSGRGADVERASASSQGVDRGLNLGGAHNAASRVVVLIDPLDTGTVEELHVTHAHGVAEVLELAMDAIDRGDAKAVVIGATDPAPHALTVGTFSSARPSRSKRSRRA